jgi:hypothetical protein
MTSNNHGTAAPVVPKATFFIYEAIAINIRSAWGIGQRNVAYLSGHSYYHRKF